MTLEHGMADVYRRWSSLRLERAVLLLSGCASASAVIAPPTLDRSTSVRGAAWKRL